MCLGFVWYGFPFVCRWCSVEGAFGLLVLYEAGPLCVSDLCGMAFLSCAVGVVWKVPLVFWFGMGMAFIVPRQVWYDVRVVWLCFTS